MDEEKCELEQAEKAFALAGEIRSLAWAEFNQADAKYKEALRALTAVRLRNGEHWEGSEARA